MSLTLVTAPTSEPITLDRAKQQLRIDVEDDDGLLLDYIAAARTWVEGQTKRCIATQTWDYVIDYEWPFRLGTYRITLPLNPVASVTSISYVDNDGASQTLATDQYSVAARTHGSFIVPAYDVTWPTIRRVPAAITVRFVAGNDSTMPPQLTQAVALVVAHMYENREPSASKAMHEIPFGIEALISPYRSATIT